MGSCCSTERRKDSSSSSNGRYVRQGQELAGGVINRAPTSPGRQAPKNQQQSKEAAWKATGLIGLRDQKLKVLPGSISELGIDAKVLDATNNQLKELPAFLGQLTSLQRLILANNKLTQAPGSIIVCLINLKVINMDNNCLVELPEELGQLQRLEKLSVNNNQLVALPSSLQWCSKLQQMLAKSNRLTSLPDECAPELEELEVSDNDIKVIPRSLGKLTKLKILSIQNNSIKAVPEEVLAAPALQTLSLHGNPITPDELAANPAFQAFEKRRVQKYDKIISGGALLGSKGLDEGVERAATRS